MRLFYLILILAYLPFSSQGKEIFIVYDPGCMDRLEYEFQANDGRGAYVSYHINLNLNEKIVLEVGDESQNIQQYVPSNFWRCDNGQFDTKLIQSINQNTDQVYMVYKVGNRRYAVNRVRLAAYFNIREDIVTYAAPKYNFRFDFNTGIIGENISSANDRSEVYFEGRLDNVCSGAFIFRQYSESRNMPAHIDMVLVPEVGIVEERSGRSVEDALQNALVLTTINDIPYQQFINKKCANIDLPDPAETSLSNNTKSEKENIIAGDEYFIVPGGEPSISGNSGLAGNQHTIKKGETLYRISKKYDISIAQIQTWNNMGASTTIFPGQKIWVGPPSQGISESISTGNDFVFAPAEDEETYAIRGGDNNPAPYDYDPTNRSYVSSYNNTDKTISHRVRPGETVASIALKYGFTEQKLREINGLEDRQIVRIGQVIKVSDCDCTEEMTNGYSGPSSYDQNMENPQQGGRVLKNSGSMDPRVYQNVPTFYDEGKNQPQNFNEPISDVNQISDNTRTYVPQGYGSTPIYQPLENTKKARRVHIVQDNETIYTIARKYKISVDDLRTINNLERGEVVIPFQRLYLDN